MLQRNYIKNATNRHWYRYHSAKNSPFDNAGYYFVIGCLVAFISQQSP
jgi:hypothetical protein